MDKETKRNELHKKAWRLLEERGFKLSEMILYRYSNSHVEQLG